MLGLVQMMMMKIILSRISSPVPPQSEQYRSCSVMTDLTAELIDCLERECATLREENLNLKKKTEKT